MSWSRFPSPALDSPTVLHAPHEKGREGRQDRGGQGVGMATAKRCQHVCARARVDDEGSEVSA